MNAEQIKEATEIFGPYIVQEVIDVVDMCDPDGAHALFLDFDKEEHAECVEMLYFEQ